MQSLLLFFGGEQAEHMYCAHNLLCTDVWRKAHGTAEVINTDVNQKRAHFSILFTPSYSDTTAIHTVQYKHKQWRRSGTCWKKATGLFKYNNYK